MAGPVSGEDETVPMQPPYVEWESRFEKTPDGEDAIVEKMVRVLRDNNEYAYRKFKRGVRDAHAKSHGILRGELEVHAGLPDELAQGLFREPATYPVITRLSSTSGTLRTDQMRGVRGLGIKVIGVDGPRALPDDTANTQDFIMVTHREFLFADAKEYLERGMPTAWALAHLTDPVLKVGEDLLAALNDRILRPLKRPLPETLEVFVRPNTHILGDTFYTSAPLRYGKYIAKMLYAPSSPEVRALAGQRTPDYRGINALQDMMIDFFGSHGAEYELRVQLCTDEKRMPIEDATVPWSEEESPHRTVATLRFAPQDPYTPQRRAYGDDILSFNSWRGLSEHTPLGSINRLKRRVYDASSQFRHQRNNAPLIEPAGVADLPD